MKRTSKVFLYTLQKNRLAFVLFVAISFLNLAVFLLYDIMTEALIYCEVLFFAILILFFVLDFLSELKKARMRERRKFNLVASGFEIIDGECLPDEDYREMINLLEEEIKKLRTDFAKKQQADNDYYTAWVHNIKTPIAVMKLELSEKGEENKELLSELFRIEQYVEMVLDYTRLESDSHDLVIAEYDLDEIIREVLRKFAHQFVLRKLKLRYEPTKDRVVTDKKWVAFILEQLISNAIKYTPAGEISIITKENVIQVSDTGIGIAQSDIPRIFEKGYTGMNGRMEQKSSGLGLFLTKKAVTLISAEISCESVVGKGSTFTLTLPML